ncbi:MAG: prolyl oligopeptidase family serine peptidase [Rubrivivax sp.]|nr:prolyl oligopeptidase family serine peptidase [Rubrivivax sp.]
MRMILRAVQRSLLVVCALLALTGSHVRAQAVVAVNPPPADAFFREADIVEAVLSPSGHRLAITTGRGGMRVGLFVIDLATAGRPRALAQYQDADIQHVHWVNDDYLIFSVTDYSQGSGRPDGWPGLFSVRADGGRVRTLVQRKRPFITDGDRGPSALEWSHLLLSVPNRPAASPGEEVLVGQFTLDNDSTPSNIEPLWLNVRTGLTRSTAFKEPPGVVHWIFDSQGEPRLVFTKKGAQRAVHWRAPGRSDWRLLVQGDLLEMPFEPLAVDDTGQLYVLHTQGPEGLRVLSRYDTERQAPSSQPVLSTPGFDFMGELLVAPGGGPVVGVRVQVDAETTVWFDEGMKRLQAVVDQRFPGRVNRVSCRRCADGDAVALVQSFSDREPGQWWIYRAKAAESQPAWQAVARRMPGIDPRQMAAVEFQRIRARDGRDLPVWLTVPKGVSPGQPAPAVVLVHGGPWTRGGYWAWEPMKQFLASRGYLVIEPEFRGSTGYGDAHYRAGWKQWGQAMQDDVADALLWAQRQGLASQRACIAGASYGGYSTLMGLARHPQLYRCGVAWAAVTDLSLLLTGSWWVDDDMSVSGRRHVLPELVGDPRQDAALLAAHSPVLLADKIKAPVLLAFGDADLRVPLAHGERMRAALKSAGHEPEWVVYPGEGHGWHLVKNQVDFAQRVERFLARHLQAPQR